MECDGVLLHPLHKHPHRARGVHLAVWFSEFSIGGRHHPHQDPGDHDERLGSAHPGGAARGRSGARRRVPGHRHHGAAHLEHKRPVVVCASAHMECIR